MMWSKLRRKALSFLSSLSLAVVVLLSLGVLIAWGTFVEARYMDSERARRTVFQAWPMMMILGLLASNLTAVMVDRWPWKRRHISFILAHVGILVLLLGSWITFRWGIDGTMRLPLKGASNFVFVPETRITLWSSFDGERFSKIADQAFDPYTHSLSQHPIRLLTEVGDIQIDQWRPYGLSDRKIQISTQPTAGAAIQFSLKGPMGLVSEWLLQARTGKLATHDFGPARIHLGLDPGPSASLDRRNEIYLEPPLKIGEPLRYVLYQSKSPEVLKGTLKAGQALTTPWMGMEFKLLQWLPKAEETVQYLTVPQKSDLTVPVLDFRFLDKSYAISLNDVVKLFTETSVYYLSYAQNRIDLGFPLFLEEFKMETYPGTQRPATYQSQVKLPTDEMVIISMNEPLKWQGYTFYQASFQQDATGKPNASILSVNYDPGRYVKHLGSLILSLGIVFLFYDRRKMAKNQLAPKEGATV